MERDATAARVPGADTRRRASETTERARAFVAARRDDATALGTRTGALVNEPADLVEALRAGLAQLADPEYREGMDRVAPGIGPTLGVRQPLLRAVTAGLRKATRLDRPSTMLDVAAHLLRAEALELHWIAFALLERTVGAAPERSWQLVREAARRADDWITVDSLAHVAARGVLAEGYRWAELEQLVYSPSPWERRLVGSTVAVLPTTDRTAGRSPEVARHGLALVRDLIGDPEPQVQKALSWAIRSMTVVDLPATVALLRDEAAAARTTGDGNRARVVRDGLEKLPAPVAAELHAAVAGIRRRPGAPNTSRAADTAAAFLGLGIDVPPGDRPIVERT